MDYSSLSCRDFVDILSTSAPVPGGGGASALVGAVGTALGSMVASLTIGKKKYADVEEDMIVLREQAQTLQKKLLALVERDAQVFEPLAAAYRMPKETQEERDAKEREMERVLKDAALVPLEIMEHCCEALDLMREFADKGSMIAISDAGVGAACCRAALQGASLNVFINTRSMSDRERAAEINDKAERLLDTYVPMADEIFRSVEAKLQRRKTGQ